jgi:hypothetical protein
LRQVCLAFFSAEHESSEATLESDAIKPKRVCYQANSSH